ncbi:hypothetical protein [Pseudomonas sp.]|nr:hypothetical protein [Pseudomonas sp.]
MVNRLPYLGRAWRDYFLGLVTSTPAFDRPEVVQLVDAHFEH